MRILPDTIFIDFDGVIAKTEGSLFEANKRALQSLNVNYSQNDFEKHTFYESGGSAKWLINRGYSAGFVRKFKRVRGDILNTLIVGFPELAEEGAIPALKFLAENTTLCLVTNRSSSSLADIKGVELILIHFSFVVTKDMYENEKPDPEPYLTAQRIARSGRSAVALEDSPKGIGSALNAGLTVLAIKNSDFPELDQSLACYKFNSINSVIQFWGSRCAA